MPQPFIWLIYFGLVYNFIMEKFLKEFSCRNKKRSLEKMEKFWKEGREKIHIITDFDLTLTPRDSRPGQDSSTWGILENYLPEAAIEKIKKLYEKYRPLEVQGEMTVADAVDWYEGALEIYKRSGIKWADIVHDVEEKMSIRPYVKDFFNACEEKEIPTIIISAGVKDVIEIWCRKFGIIPAVLLSTDLLFNSEGRIRGWEKDSLIHIFNKKEKGHKEISGVRQSRPNIILIGDTLYDAAMADGDDNVLRVIIDDPRKDDASRSQSFYDNVFQKFDLMIKDKSFFPLVKMIRSF